MASPKSSRTPVYFLGIGGPNFIENTSHPAYAKLAAIGQEITSLTPPPKAVVVLSAHWQASGPNKLEINVAEDAGIIYDFYGFPDKYYQVEYPNRGSKEVAEKIIALLEGKGIEVDRVRRGLDHGVWAGFIAAFHPKKNPLNIPIVQVSLHGNEDPNQHYRLGQMLEGLRDEGILIIGAGMAVHNTRDYRRTLSTGNTMPYVSTFDAALREAVTANSEQRQAKMAALMDRSDAQQAHPSAEHLMPLFVAAGAAGVDAGERVWTLAEGSLSWAQYRFGDVRKA